MEKEEIRPETPRRQFSEGDVVRATGETKVYVIRSGRRLWIPTLAAFTAGEYDWSNVQEVAAADLTVYPRLSLVRAQGDPKVYYLTENGLKKWLRKW